MREKIRAIVLNCVKEAANVQGLSIKHIDDTTDLIGNEGIFDSMASITLITFLEDRIKKELSISVSLINEIDNNTDNNTFQNLVSLTEFIENRVKNENADS